MYVKGKKTECVKKSLMIFVVAYVFINYFLSFFLGGGAPMAHGGSQPVAAGLHHSHSNAGSLTR